MHKNYDTQLMAQFLHDVANDFSLISTQCRILDYEIEKLEISKRSEIRKQIERLNSTVDNLLKKKKYLNLIITNSYTKPIIFNVYDCILEYLELLVTGEQISIVLNKNNHLYKDYTLYGNKSAFAKIIVAIIINSLESFSRKNIYNKTIWIEVNKDFSGNMEIKIKDNGVGVTSENLQHVFNQGFSTKSHKAGTGLFIVKSILRTEFDGSILLESVHQTSTTVKINIPCNG